MATKYMNLDTLRFLLYEVLNSTQLLDYRRFQDYDKESLDILLDSFKDFADKDMYPYFREMDEKPARLEDGKIITHPQLGNIIRKAAKLGWIGADWDYDKGGMQLPEVFYFSLAHIMDCANNHVTGYTELTSGSAKLIVTFGDQELYDAFIPHMLEGRWMGTMSLTEPQAGSSLSDITTIAYPTDEGYYRIKGQKIFISGGDHQHAENFVHLTLARIEGAPAGTKGISLFVVPKHRPTDEGSLENNDVVTAGEFQKMGQKGYTTVHLVMGENDNCHGWLVGEPNRGLKYMFQMMNEARITVGISAASMATAAYYASLQYAKERPQGRRLMKGGEKDLSKSQTLIINHPDVRRMLLLQKAIAEGSLALCLQSALFSDLHKVSEGDKKKDYHLLLELMTPVAKAYPSEMASISISNGLQVLGGYGYCSDFVLQQYYRDVRITAIYEGTTGIQSLDLLGRKLTMHKSQALQLIIEEISNTIRESVAHVELMPYAKALTEKIELSKNVVQRLMEFAVKGEHELFLADATVFMEFFGTLIVGWQWLKIGLAAQKALSSGEGSFSKAFYESKIHTMKFFYKYELPKTYGLAMTLLDGDVLTIKSEKEILF